MFEYLMPALWFEHRHRTILGETVRVAVECQVESAGKSQPWGISEAAFSEQYPDGHYKYHAFGVPFLALNPTSSQDVVVSPYSSFLALAVDPHEAVQNLQRLRDMGCLGELGFYDAVDFAPDRRDPAQGFKRIPCWMVHHQGMSLISACDLLTGGAIHKLFHSEPAVRATELLLDEKPPHTPPRVERSSNAAAGAELSLKGNGHDSRA